MEHEASTEAGNGRRRIGEIFVELGFVTATQLEKALEVQRRNGGRIGEILIEQGSLTRLDLASALAEFWEPQRWAPVERRPVSLLGTSRAFDEPRADAPLGAPHLDSGVPGEGVAALEERTAAAIRAQIDGLARAVQDLSSLRRADALAIGERLAALERAVEDLRGSRAHVG